MEHLSPQVQALVRQRAGGRCEYGQLPEALSELPFQIDHIIARKHGGKSQLDNLAYTCLYCNSYKGPHLSGIDPITGEMVRLFNPRIDKWNEHFEWHQAWLNGLSPQGRATIQVLNINQDEAVLVRQNLLRESRF